MVYINELYPTEYRNIATGMAWALGSFGPIICLYLIDIAKIIDIV